MNIKNMFIEAGLKLVLISITFGLLRRIIKLMSPQNLEEVKRHRIVCGKEVFITEAEEQMSQNVLDAEGIQYTFQDVGGLENAKEILQQHVVFPFRSSFSYTGKSLRRHPKGILLYGPPGSGKTLLASALAKELGCTFLNVKLNSLFGRYVGESEKNAAAIFSVARLLQPTVIFVDEIDSFLNSRKGDDVPSYAHTKAIFLTEWDGIEKYLEGKIILVAATNRKDALDKAILRRLPLQVPVELPDIEARKKILDILLSEDMNDSSEKKEIINFVAGRTNGFSGADLEELCKSAALLSCQIQPVQEASAQASTASPRDVHAEDDAPPILLKHFQISLKRMKDS